LRRFSIRAIALTVVFVLLLSGCGVIGGGDTDTSSGIVSKTEGQKEAFALGWAINDTVNPYKAKSKLNKELTTLLYDGLYTTAPDFSAVPRLAQACSTADDLVYYVSLKANAVFTDTTQVTSDDVVYSFEAARKSSSGGYKDMLNDIGTCTAVDLFTVCFTLKRLVPEFESLLVFPVIKAYSDEGETPYGTSATPVGTGRYVFNRNYGSAWLSSNGSWCGGSVNIQRIELVDVPDNEALSYYVEVGKVSSWYTDLSGETLPTYPGSYIPVDLRNVVFLVSNSENELLDDRMRRVISCCIDRETLASSAYYGQALAANGIYSPAKSATASYQGMDTEKDSETANRLLYEMGYTSKNSDGKLLGADGNLISFRLLCNSESSSRLSAARTIASACALAGITVLVDSKPREEYLTAIEEGNFDLYLGEMKLNSNHDLTTLLNINGVGSNSAAAGTYKKLKKGSANLSEFIAAQDADLSVMPLLYRRGVVVVTGRLTGLTPSSTDIYYNIQECVLS